MPRILITGATSGIGLGILKAYYEKGWEVTAINRRQVPELENQFPKARFEHFDVRDAGAVKRYFEEATRKEELPAIYFLSAGINKPDNAEFFSIDVFREVLETDLTSVFEFIAHALPLAKEGTIFVGASSTTNIFPNPSCLAYCISKRGLHDAFKLLDHKHKDNGIRFKSLILGPIATNIFAPGGTLSKAQTMVRNALTVSVETSIPPMVRFIEGNCQAFYYPKFSCLFFWALNCVNKIIPLYGGSGSLKTK